MLLLLISKFNRVIQAQKNRISLCNRYLSKMRFFYFLNVVGVARFELATSRPPDARATKLRYTPIDKLNGDKSLCGLY